MATYYVGAGGNDSNNGTTWALRKLTLNGAENIPVAAGDTVYVGAGTYRETLVCDVSGSSGNPITFVGDVTGKNTDGIGGEVRVTGIDSDTTGAFVRTRALDIGDRSYRDWYGFSLDGCTTASDGLAYINTGTNIRFYDCKFSYSGRHGIYSLTGTNITALRCIFVGIQDACINFSSSTAVANGNHLVQSCYFGKYKNFGIRSGKCGGITVQACHFAGRGNGVEVATALEVGYTAIQVNGGCIFESCGTALKALATGEIVEDYNNFNDTCLTKRSNVSTGANSVDYPAFTALPLLVNGYRADEPHTGQLAPYSPLLRRSSNSAHMDIFGLARPATNSKASWGVAQTADYQYDATETYLGEPTLKLNDAGRVQFEITVVSGESITVSVWAKRGANYAGTAAQMVIKEPGVADNTTTESGTLGAWNNLSRTFTPAFGRIVVELVSNNTATSGSYQVNFGKLQVGDASA